MIPRTGTRVRWSAIDEAAFVIGSSTEPWNIHIEAAVTGRLDDARLRTAVAAALSLHPFARVRVRLPAAGGRQEWEIPQVLDLDPVETIICANDAELGVARAALLSREIPLSLSPPLRVLLARHPAGDVVLMSLHHAAADGISALRLLRSIARAYANEPDPLPAVDPLATRDLAGWVSNAGLRAALRRVWVQARELHQATARSSRFVSDGAAALPGYGVCNLALRSHQTEVLTRSHPGGATVNDMLVAAMHLAVGQWNEKHGGPAGRVGIMMPVNLRPRTWWHEVVGNFAFLVPVATQPRDRAGPAAVLSAVTRRTRQVKRDRAAAVSAAGISHLQALPAPARTALGRVATSERFAPTALLSNLGALPGTLHFGTAAGEVTRLWFSPPAKMPYGLSVGAVTYRSQLFLSFRYRYPLLSETAACAFARCYLAAVDAVERLAGDLLTLPH
ncbi:MAG TPA: condensation domain-containing protein [Actinomycetota bacterium]